MPAERALLGALAAQAAPAALFLPPVRRLLAPGGTGRGAAGHVALSFDDGPHPEATPRILDVLAAHRVRATFFVLGEQLRRYPELGRAIVEQGHELAVHAWRHRCLLWTLRPYEELARTVEVIERTGGKRPAWVRAPYGVFGATSLLAARRLGLAPVWWTCWGYDWARAASAGSVAATVLRGLRGGGTVLLHDSDIAAVPGSWRSTLGALPLLLDHCREAGLAVGPLAEHFAEDRESTVDDQGVQVYRTSGSRSSLRHPPVNSAGRKPSRA